MPPAAPVSIPIRFLERMSRFLGAEYPDFLVALDQPAVHGLRINTLKLDIDEFRQVTPFPLGKAVPWCPSAFILDPDERPGKHPWHNAGLYYLQDPSAMIPAELVNPQPGERVLDLAAAPGGKTTHLASLMQGRGLLVANEIKTKRLNHLVVNVERWGAGQVVVTNETPERLADHFGAVFDQVLVDAPCSGEGMFRKDMGARADWSEEMINGCSIRQGNILRVAAHLVRPGGKLLYSTCTFAPEEDEGVLSNFLFENPDFVVIKSAQHLGFDGGHPEWLAETESSLSGAVRLFPHRVPGEGHFACLMQRGGIDPEHKMDVTGKPPLPKSLATLWESFQADVLQCELPRSRLSLQGDRLYLMPENALDLRGLRVAIPGVWLGNFKKDRFEPAHPLALYLQRGQAKQALDFPAGSRECAAYLRGEGIQSDGPSGWVVVCVDGFPLGWGKRVQGIVKNHYPRGWQNFS